MTTPPKMRLRYSQPSPYVRKVMVLAHETGLIDRLEPVPTQVWEDNTDIHQDNPLGKVPALTLPDGSVMPESAMICLYLDDLHEGPRLFPTDPVLRPRALRWMALGDGITNAALARTVEFVRRPPEERGHWWPDRMKKTIDGTLDQLNAEAEALADSPITIGQIAIGCALGYLDFRFAEDDWRATRAPLSAWFEAFSQRPSMLATQPPKG
jgi:glutathione S-transferase